VAITNGYVTEAQFRAAIGDSSSVQQSTIEIAIQTASRRIDALCGRRFYKDTNATVRYYDRVNEVLVEVDDFWTTSGLIVEVDTGDDGVYEQSWTINTDFEVLPVNGLVGALPWPYTGLHALSTLWFTASSGRKAIKVTAKWGWAAVPDAVQMATLLIAKDLYKRPESLAGGYVGLDGWGPARLREDPAVMEMLRPFVAANLFFVG
jgi:hypothetical protein